MNNTYNYSPLREGHFRILEILSTEPVITIRLFDYSNDNTPDYHAVSYAWGSQPNTEAIRCGDSKFFVTPHLYDGLRCIYEAYGATKLWVDVICINQNSDTEKAAQVARMHNIYHNGVSVYVWLGKAENNSDLVIDAINNLEDEELHNDDNFSLQRVFHLKSEAKTLFDANLFKPVALLSDRGWFRRLWVAQEYFMAKKVTFFCGLKVLDGLKFIQTLRNLTRYSFTGPEPSIKEEQDLFKGFQALTELQTLKDKHEAGTALSFFDFVMSARRRFVGEAVDRIYAVFGMAERSDKIYRKNIEIDYSEEARKNFWRLYTKFGKVALQHEPRLRLLNDVSSLTRPGELPSWCPNIHSEKAVADLDGVSVFAAGWPWHDHRRIGGPRNCDNHRNFKGPDENHVVINQASDSVSIWGAALGRILHISITARDWSDLVGDINLDDIASVQKFADSFLRFYRQSEEFCQRHNKFDRHMLTREHVWNEVLVGATGRPGQLKGNTSSHSTRGSTHRISTGNDNSPTCETEMAYDFVLHTLRSILALNSAIEWKSQNLPLREDFEICYTMLLFLAENWRGRVLFATENGYIGFASADVTVGDMVTVLYGGGPLFVLRRENNSYQFVDNAYVYKCVAGEVFDMLDEGYVKEDLFLIS